MVRRERNKRNYGLSQKAGEEINEVNNEPPMLSRIDSRQGRKKSAFQYPLLNILIVFFLLIPIVIVIVYVAVQNTGTTNSFQEADSSVKVSKSEATKEKSAEEKKKREEAKKKEAAEAAEKKEAEEKAEKERLAAEKEEQEKAAAEKVEQEKAEQERIKNQKALKEAEQKQTAKKSEQKQTAKKSEQQRINKQKQPTTSGRHTVKSGETLYGIARSFYGSSGAPAGVQKIKQANGLSKNEVPVGTTLIIPK